MPNLYCDLCPADRRVVRAYIDQYMKEGYGMNDARKAGTLRFVIELATNAKTVPGLRRAVLYLLNQHRW